MAEVYKVVTTLYAYVYKNIGTDGNPKSKNNTILMGSFVKFYRKKMAIGKKFMLLAKKAGL